MCDKNDVFLLLGIFYIIKFCNMYITQLFNTAVLSHYDNEWFCLSMFFFGLSKVVVKNSCWWRAGNLHNYGMIKCTWHKNLCDNNLRRNYFLHVLNTFIIVLWSRRTLHYLTTLKNKQADYTTKQTGTYCTNSTSCQLTL